jgi:hypothetical protein
VYARAVAHAEPEPVRLRCAPAPSPSPSTWRWSVVGVYVCGGWLSVCYPNRLVDKILTAR